MPALPGGATGRPATHVAADGLYTAEQSSGWVYHSWLWTVVVAALYALTLNGAGRKAEARALIGNALRKNPNDDTLRRARSRL